tara:strand:+ start:1719 stop:2210 length:492 start_codon:yes stop_codon:yes gene_type:complete
LGSLTDAAKDSLLWYARYKVSQTVEWAGNNPARAMVYSAGAAASISNATVRGIMIDVGKHIARQALKDAGFYSRLIVTRVVGPVARAGVTGARAGAGAAARSGLALAQTPAVAIPAVALAGGVAGGALSAAIVTGINREHNIPSSSPQAMWSPFGGFQLGTVV